MSDATLKEKILDAVIDGHIDGTPYPHGIHLNAGILKTHFLSKDHSENYLNVFLANSEMSAGTKYQKFVIRIDEGKYLIHPLELAFRMRERGMI